MPIGGDDGGEGGEWRHGWEWTGTNRDSQTKEMQSTLTRARATASRCTYTPHTVRIIDEDPHHHHPPDGFRGGTKEWGMGNGWIARRSRGGRPGGLS
jgi:hypothetical protein